MAEFIFLMHALPDGVSEGAWAPYLGKLGKSGHLRGGSVIGGGECFAKNGIAPPVTAHVDGFIRIGAASIEEAATLLEGNPVYESGGTVEIRELPQTD
jgi:hypothetical protein